jgi:hypothetical protein
MDGIMHDAADIGERIASRRSGGHIQIGVTLGDVIGVD